MVRTTTVPADSRILPFLRDAHFHDAFEVDIADGCQPALHWYLEFASRTPRWIDALMSLRNRAVGLFGLKDLGRLSAVPPPDAASRLREGDRAGIFTIRYLSDKEVLLEDCDRHLDVCLSVYRTGGTSPILIVTTVVSIHNPLGWLYMLPVVPMHKLIVRAMLSNGTGA